MILTEIFVVICTLAGIHCTNYVAVAAGNLSATACENAIQELVKDRIAADMVLRRERSSCTLMPVNTQNDLAS
jgi:hypothetical protein